MCLQETHITVHLYTCDPPSQTARRGRTALHITTATAGPGVKEGRHWGRGSGLKYSFVDQDLSTGTLRGIV
jgi:hypothetical protein